MTRESGSQPDRDSTSDYNMRIGLKMFLFYGLVYAGFVIINITHPLLMEKIIFSGLNLAVVYGFGLIVFAFVLALIYNGMCRRKEKEMNAAYESKAGE